MNLKKEISIKELAIGLLTIRGESISPDTITKERKGVMLNIRNNGFPYKEDSNHKVGYWLSKETVLSMLSVGRGKNKELRSLAWENLLSAVDKGKKKAEEYKEQVIDASKGTKYSYWHLQLRDVIEPLMREGKSIRKPLKDYYKELVEKLYTLEALPTALMILVKHRKYLKEASLKATQNKWKKSLVTKGFSQEEWNSYEVDLENARGIFMDPEELKNRAEIKQNESLEKKHENRKPLPYTLPEFQSKFNKLFNSFDVRDNILGAFLATGRRSEEMWESGEFRLATEEEIKGSYFPYLDVNSSFFIKGLAKKKEDDMEGVFPCLYDSERVLDAIQSLRKKKINKGAMIRHMRESHPELGTALHDMRRFYALYSYSLYNQNPSFSPILWAKRALGHESDNWTSLHSYMVHMLKE